LLDKRVVKRIVALVRLTPPVRYVPRVYGIYDRKVLRFDILKPTDARVPVVVRVRDGIRLARMPAGIWVRLVLDPDLLHDTALPAVQKQLSQHHLGLLFSHPFRQLLELVVAAKGSLCGAHSFRSAGAPVPAFFHVAQHLQHILNASPPVH
jgi:hypothetical protein